MPARVIPLAAIERLRKAAVSQLRRFADELEKAPLEKLPDVLVRLPLGEIEKAIRLVLGKRKGEDWPLFHLERSLLLIELACADQTAIQKILKSLELARIGFPLRDPAHSVGGEICFDLVFKNPGGAQGDAFPHRAH